MKPIAGTYVHSKRASNARYRNSTFHLFWLFLCPRNFEKLPWTGSERYGFRCRRLQEMFRRTASCRRADHKKSCRHFCLGQQRSPQRPHSPSGEPSENPRHFAVSMDESVIVGYYTLKKCRSPALPLSVNLKERKRQWQEMME